MPDSDFSNFYIDEASQKLASDVAGKIRAWLSDVRFEPGFQYRQQNVPREILRSAMVDIPAGDVETDVGWFAQSVVLAKEFDRPIPVVRLSEQHIIPILEPFSDSIFQRFLRYPGSRFEFVANSWWPFSQISFEPPKTAINYFVHELEGFLARRIAGFGFWQALQSRGGGGITGSGPSHPTGTSGMTGAGGSFAITLEANNPGMRAHACPAYGVSWRFFGHPTPRVTGYLRSGHWIFAGDGGPVGAWTPDSTVFHIPPTYTPKVIAF